MARVTTAKLAEAYCRDEIESFMDVYENTFEQAREELLDLVLSGERDDILITDDDVSFVDHAAKYLRGLKSLPK